jgi:16S rRNA (cytidine1402-2'-O)-methyltransferase
MSTLYIVATPIGNMQDITLRAIDVLKNTNIICAEDSRVVGKLLKKLDIPHKKIISINEFADDSKIAYVISLLKDGQDVCYVSDAGTPGISDPGAVLVSAARTEEITIVPIGGISAVTTALSVAGIRETPFLFYGFLPHKKGRQKILDALIAQHITLVFYESPHRFMKLLEELQTRENEHINFSVTVCRELTKMYEDVQQGRPAEMLTHYTTHKDTQRGEFVLIVRPMDVSL